MKIEYDENQYIIYINYFYEKKIQFKEKNELEKYFHKLFKKLNKFYNISLSGYYNIHIYYNEYYGAVITLEKEDYEYYDYFEDKLDMRISVSQNSPFLYELEDFNEVKCIKDTIYQYRNKFYIELKEELSTYTMGKLLEHSTLLFEEDEIENILHFGRKVNRKESGYHEKKCSRTRRKT